MKIYAVYRYIPYECSNYYGYYTTRKLAEQALVDLSNRHYEPSDAEYSVEEITVRDAYNGELCDNN